MSLFGFAADIFSAEASAVWVHHVVQAEDRVLAETVCLHVQMGPYQRKGQASHAQPSHQQGQWSPDTHKDLTGKPGSWNVSFAHNIANITAFFNTRCLSVTMTSPGEAPAPPSFWLLRFYMTFITRVWRPAMKLSHAGVIWNLAAD